jgi:hypothetical protein
VREEDEPSAWAREWIESILRAIVWAAGDYLQTLRDFLLRRPAFDAAVVGAETAHVSGRLGPLTYLLINLILYFFVYPRREQGPTRAIIDAAPAPIANALDRVEAILARPDLPSLFFLVGPLVLLIALHALLTTRGLRLIGRPVRFDALLAVGGYSLGSLLAALALSAIVGASLTDRAVAGTLVGPALVVYLVGMVVPFVSTFVWCLVRYVDLVRTASGAGFVQSTLVVLAATVVLGVMVGVVLLTSGLRAG